MITKKIGKLVFGWDPTALNGKGYWYLWSPGDSLSRAASSTEAQKLGKPKAQDLPKPGADKKKYYYTVGKTGKPVKRKIYTGSEYEESDIARSKGLMTLASERMASGEGLGASLKGAISDKIKSKGMGIKKMFDPMNMLSKLPGVGKLAATAYGMKKGRKPEDISYFTGVHVPEPEQAGEETSGGETTSSRTAEKTTKSKSETKVLSQIYKLLVDKFEADKLIKEKESAFDEENKSELEQRHKELIEAITKKQYNPNKKEKEKKEETSSIFDKLLLGLGTIFTGFIGKLAGMFGPIAAIASKLGAGVLRAGAAAAGGALKVAGKVGSSIKSGISSIMGKASPKVTKTGLDTTKSALFQAKPGTVTKVTETAEKAGSSLAKAGSTTSKVAGAGSKLLKGGAKLLGFLKSVPGISTLAAGADLIMKVGDVNSRLESGEISDADYKKELTKSIGEAAAAGLLPALGAALGSIIPGVGTLVGGLAGAGVALMGGDKVGGYVAEKAYDYFVDDKKSTSSELEKPTATAVPSSTSSSPSVSSSGQVPSQGISSSGVVSGGNPSTIPAPVASLTPAVPSRIATRAQSATNENLNLTGGTAKSSAPVIINNSTNNVMNGKSGGGSMSAMVRNDDPILTRLQFQNVRPV